MGLCVGRGVGCARCSGEKTADKHHPEEFWLLAALLKTVTKQLETLAPRGATGVLSHKYNPVCLVFSPPCHA